MEFFSPPTRVACRSESAGRAARDSAPTSAGTKAGENHDNDNPHDALRGVLSGSGDDGSGAVSLFGNSASFHGEQLAEICIFAFRHTGASLAGSRGGGRSQDRS